MISKIKEFIKIFKYTWHKYYEDKECAKKCLDFIYQSYKKRQELFDDAFSIRFKLTHIWPYLPKKQRQDYIQKTLDLLEYGIHYEYDENNKRIGNPKYNEGYGLCDKFYYLVNYLEAKYKEAKKAYKEKDFLKVQLLNKETYEYLNDFDKKILDM